MTLTTEPEMTPLDGRERAAVCPLPVGERWLKAAKPGDRLVYAEASYLPSAERAPVLAVLRAAHDEGLIEFTALKLGGGMYRYFATKRAKAIRRANRFVPRAGSAGQGVPRGEVPRPGSAAQQERPHLRVVK